LLAKYTIKPKGTLSPRRITIIPHWKNILVHHKIVDEAEFDRLDFLCHAGSEEPVWLRSFRIDVLSPELYYNKKYDYFATEWDEDETVLSRLPTDKEALAELRTQFPKLFRKYSMLPIPTIRIAIEHGEIFLITDEFLERGGEYYHLPESGTYLAAIPTFLFSYYRGYLLGGVPSSEYDACFDELGWRYVKEEYHEGIYIRRPPEEYKHKYFTLIIQRL
jgi:hypothetical protein